MKQIIVSETILKTIQKNHTLIGRGALSLNPAKTSEEILEQHRKNKADLIITDLTLPVMGGVKLCEAIRKDEKLKSVSIIMVCDNSDVAMIQCQRAGANAILPQPLQADELFVRISDLLIIPKRQAMRVLMRISVKGQNGTDFFFASSQDVSVSGMRLETDKALPKGAQLSCAFFVGHIGITVQGTVTRTFKTPQGAYQYGVRFQNLDTKSLVTIEQFVKEKIQNN